MKKLKMKIVDFDEKTFSLIVCFSSDETKHNEPEKYQSFTFQPLHMWPDIRDVDEIQKRIAVAGIYHAEQQKISEDIYSKPNNFDIFKSLIGTTTEYDVDDLLNKN